MLVLARKRNQQVVIDGRIYVKVLRLERDGVKLAVEAPRSIPVFREEIYNEIQNSNRSALTQGRRKSPKLSTKSRPRQDPSAA